MCCFSREIKAVEKTRIFARATSQDRQCLVYQMAYEADDDLAMILPLPTPPKPTEDAVRFIDLSKYKEFFADAEKGFFVPSFELYHDFFSDSDSRPLVVHDVGSFEASFVPRLADFSRLDPRFQLPQEVWAKLSQYADWSFCIFKLKPGTTEVHPMAFEFPRRDPALLFYPTVHIHDGDVHPEAKFDHVLFCQTAEGPEGWRGSFEVPKAWDKYWDEATRNLEPAGPYGITFEKELNEELEKELKKGLKKKHEIVDALLDKKLKEEREKSQEIVNAFWRIVDTAPKLPTDRFMDITRTQGLVDGKRPLYRRPLYGTMPNEDVFVRDIKKTG